MRTIKITNIKWNLKNSFYDTIPSEFMVDVDGVYDNDTFTCDGPDGDVVYTTKEFVEEWISYNGSKWGATAKSFDFNLVD